MENKYSPFFIYIKETNPDKIPHIIDHKYVFLSKNLNSILDNKRRPPITIYINKINAVGNIPNVLKLATIHPIKKIKINFSLPKVMIKLLNFIINFFNLSIILYSFYFIKLDN